MGQEFGLGAQDSFPSNCTYIDVINNNFLPPICVWQSFHLWIHVYVASSTGHSQFKFLMLHATLRTLGLAWGRGYHLCKNEIKSKSLIVTCTFRQFCPD